MKIKMEHVTLRRQQKTILEDINWEVANGEIWAILGLNGAGKSTLLRLILAEFWQSEGEIEILDTSFGTGDISQLRKKIGIVGSFIAERFPRGMRAEEIVLTGKFKSSILYTSYEETDLKQAQDMMKLLKADSLIGRKYDSLSQGERQIILIARALMDKPQILILDEATSGLDLFAREQLLHHIEQISQMKQAPTIIYVTHHAEEITTFMTHLLLLKNGKIIAKGKKEDVFIPHVLNEFYDCPVTLVPIGEQRYFIKPEVKYV
ncbi:ABC transporter ATP binding protein [Streptococcus sp. DD10]|uniref:ABC transporter ATP-binding protein n=1 Tax=Streptococcus sp. DD10 TaxID=1777878 RepID=UPI0007946A19|nr:ABC transporter ATP-binding protein [Streptococcus sp. DD10]KXT72612.1 ABC transporter ATP binding protein [Streptococcus sp. DD10]